jgi:FAD/FMN-containing dehydrogenase
VTDLSERETLTKGFSYHKSMPPDAIVYPQNAEEVV